MDVKAEDRKYMLSDLSSNFRAVSIDLGVIDDVWISRNKLRAVHAITVELVKAAGLISLLFSISSCRTSAWKSPWGIKIC